MLQVCRNGGLTSKCFFGGLGTIERMDTIVSFEEEKDPLIIVGTYYTLGVAFTLTRAWRCIMFEPEWDRDSELQAKGRIHRIGAQRPTESFRLLMEDSVDIQISERHRHLGEFSKTALGKLPDKGGEIDLTLFDDEM